MDKHKKNIDQFFLEQLAGAREAPPASVWQDLEEKLKGNTSTNRSSGKGFVISLSILIVAAGGAAYFWNRSSAPPLHQTVQVAVAGNDTRMPGRYDAGINSSETPSGTTSLKGGPNPSQAQKRQLPGDTRMAGNAAIHPAADYPERNTLLNPDAAPVKGIAPQPAARHNSPAPLRQGAAAQEAAKENKVLEAGSGQQSIATSVQPEQKLSAAENIVADNIIPNDPDEAAIYNKDKEPIRTDNNTIPDEEQGGIVMHKVEFKGAGSAPGKPATVQNTASEYSIEKAAPATKTIIKAAAESPETAVEEEGLSRRKIAILAPKSSHIRVVAKPQPEQRLSIAGEQRARKSLNLFLGIKAGYETGFSSFTSGKYVGSVFGEVQVSDRWSFLLQPGIKVAKLNRTLFRTGSYFQAGTTTSSLFGIHGDDSSGYTYDYAYLQTYDSIITSVETKKKFTELELPLFVRYKINPQFSAMAGVNFTFGNIALWNNKLQTISGLTITDTVLNTPDTVAPAASAKFAHNGSTPFSAYKPNALPANTSPVRFGYSLGLTYTFRERLMLDLLLQQNLSGYRGITEPDIRQVFSQAYLRLSVGYRLFGTGKK